MRAKTRCLEENEEKHEREENPERKKKKISERPLSDLQNIFLEDQRVRRSVVKEEEEQTIIWRTLGQHLVNILQEKNGIVLHISSTIGQVEPETAALLPLEVLVEPRAAAVEHVLAPVDKGSSPSEAQEALFFSSGLAFSSSGATTLPHINDAWMEVAPPP